MLKILATRADLDNPESVKLAIARYKKNNNQNASNSYKQRLTTDYARYCKHYNITWTKPKYKAEEKSIQPPTQERTTMLIASAHGKLSIKLDISAQTGLRPIEIQGNTGLKPKDLHPDQNTITAISAKGCNARPPIKITQQLMTRLQAYITKNNIKPDEKIFPQESSRYSDAFIDFKKRLAKRLNDPSILSIRLYDLRHAYITRQLRRTQNTEQVRIIVGHKRLNTTQKYLHLLANSNGEWIVEGTTDKERAKQLLTEDFQYQLTTPDGTMLFRKPK